MWSEARPQPCGQLQAVAASCEKDLLLPSYAGQELFKKAVKSLLGTCVDGIQAGGQGRQGTTKAQESPSVVRRCKLTNHFFEATIMLVSRELQATPLRGCQTFGPSGRRVPCRPCAGATVLASKPCPKETFPLGKDFFWKPIVLTPLGLLFTQMMHLMGSTVAECSQCVCVSLVCPLGV